MNKKVIIIGVVSALLIGGGVFWWMRGKKKAQAEEEAKKKAEEEAAAKAAEEAAAREKESSNKATQSTPKETYPATPFKSKEEGNAFRAWVNKTKPDWRLKGDVLAPTGEFDNSTIRAAYKEFGSAYQAELKKLADTSENKKNVKEAVERYEKRVAEIKQRKALGQTLYSEGAIGKKVRPIGGNSKGYVAHYFDSGRKKYTRFSPDQMISVKGGKHLFSDWSLESYDKEGFWWLKNKYNGQFIIANPEHFEAI